MPRTSRASSCSSPCTASPMRSGPASRSSTSRPRSTSSPTISSCVPSTSTVKTSCSPAGVPCTASLRIMDAEQRVLDAIDEDALVQELVDLIRVPSVTGTDAESELQHRHAGQLRELGLDVDAWKFDLDELYADPRFPGIEAERHEGYGVVGTIG